MTTAVKRLVFGALALGFVTMPALGQDTGESCAAIGDDAQRLACYDGVFRSEAPATTGGELVFSSERLIPARPSGREPATISVACVAGVPTVHFGFANQLVSSTGDIAPVTLQVDQGPTLVRTMPSSPDNTFFLVFFNDTVTMAAGLPSDVVIFPIMLPVVIWAEIFNAITVAIIISKLIFFILLSLWFYYFKIWRARPCKTLQLLSEEKNRSGPII